MTLAMKVFGVNDCLAAFRELPRVVRGRGMKIGLNAAGGIIRDAAVANVPADTGLLRKSIKVDVKVPDLSYNTAHHGRPARAKIGPSTRVIGVKSYTKAGKQRKGFKTVRLKQGATFRSTARRPARYAHIVEKGTKRGMPASRFLARAVASAGEAAKAKCVEKIRQAISEFAARRSARSLQAIGA